MVLAIIPPSDFLAFGGAQATIEAEAREHAEALVAAGADAVAAEAGLTPTIMVRSGQPVEVVHKLLDESPEVSALVLGAAASGPPGPLVTHFTGADCGALPCPVMIVPGGLDLERLAALS